MVKLSVSVVPVNVVLDVCVFNVILRDLEPICVVVLIVVRMVVVLVAVAVGIVIVVVVAGVFVIVVFTVVFI